MRLTTALFALTLFATLPACGDRDDDNAFNAGNSTNADGANECACTDEGVTLTAVSGCDNFGGDEEECSGWASCADENAVDPSSSFSDGTELTCFGCTIRINCP